jgi:hypothetical protein
MTKFKLLVLISLLLIIISRAKSQNHFQISQPFSTETIPPIPAYEEIKNWAAHPFKKDMADSIPRRALKNITDAQLTAKADVFFIHPTIYTQAPNSVYAWNADVNDKSLNEKVDKSTILNQASLFNGSCRVFAPRYRQAHYAVFTTKDSIASKNALDVAYSDVKASFEYYLQNENKGRPIVIAGHSQGTVHAKRLLKEFFDNKPLQKLLVEAYLVGIATLPNEFENIKPSVEPNHFGGFVSWNTYLYDYLPPYYKNGLENAFVINPMTWTTTTEWVMKNKNSGGVGYGFKMVPNAVDAKVGKGILWIHRPYVKGRMFLKQKIWHAADYNLFWMDTRENVALRIDQYLKSKNY